MVRELAGIIVTALVGVVGGLGIAHFEPRVRFAFERRKNAWTTRQEYVPPLLSAAFDLQSRLYNIVRRDFLTSYLQHGSAAERRYAICSTMWLMGQYFAWVEKLRRAGLFLDYGSRSSALQLRLMRVARMFATDQTDDPLAVFRSSQRGIGELMLVAVNTSEIDERTRVRGYAEFVRTYDEDPRFAAWFEDIAADVERLSAHNAYERIIGVQRALMDLIDLLDGDRARFPQRDLRGRLPLAPRARRLREDPFKVAWFNVSARDYADPGIPWSRIDAWAETHEMRETSRTAYERIYDRHCGLMGATVQIAVEFDGRAVTFGGRLVPPVIVRWLPISSEPCALDARGLRFLGARRRALAVTDGLLGDFDRPLLRTPRRG